MKMNSSTNQAYKGPSIRTIAAPGGKTMRAIVPSDDMAPDSKRAELIEGAEDDLETEMDFLKEGARLRNLELEKRMMDINDRGKCWGEKLKEEIVHRNVSHKEREDMFLKIFDQLQTGIISSIDNVFECIEIKNIPPEQKREAELSSDFDEFINITVPNVIESLQGSITRRLKKSHETFEIDNTKLMKREKKIVDRYETHEYSTNVAFQNETKTRFNKFQSINEDMHNTMKTDDRQSEATQSDTVQSICTLNKEFQEERRVREKEDIEILQNLAQSMAKLQHSILINFGDTKNASK